MMRFAATLALSAASVVCVFSAQARSATSRKAAAARLSEADARQEAALLAAAGDGFRILRSSHFLIAYNGTADDAKPLITRIEQVYQSIYRFCDAHRIEAARPPHRLEVIFFHTYEQYRTYARGLRFPANGTYGFYNDADNRAVFYNVENDRELAAMRREIEDSRRTAAAIEKQIARTPAGAAQFTLEFSDGTRRTFTRDQARRELARSSEQLRKLSLRAENYADTINRTVIQHETTHQILFNAGVLARGAATPPWLTEGLAMLFETPPTGSGSGIGVVNTLRLRDFRSVVTGDDTKKAITLETVLAAMRKGRLAPLRELLTDGSLFDARGEAGAAYYAQAWALVHYLHRTKTKEFAAYLKEIGRRRAGRPPSAADELATFERIFGTVDDAFVKRWIRYILALPPPPA